MMAQRATQGHNHPISVSFAVATKPALQPGHVNPVHGISKVTFIVPVTRRPMYDSPASCHVTAENCPRL